jgi:hypothetical protein
MADGGLFCAGEFVRLSVGWGLWLVWLVGWGDGNSGVGFVGGRPH